VFIEAKVMDFETARSLLGADVCILGVQSLRLGKALQGSCYARDVLHVQTDVEKRIKRVRLGITLKAGHYNSKQWAALLSISNQISV